MQPSSKPTQKYSRNIDQESHIKELIEYIALSLVEDPSQVVVSQYHGGGRENLELHVAREDMGRVIGKGGRIANHNIAHGEKLLCERAQYPIFHGLGYG